ncbi:hypothetical protein PVAP13_9NG407700 [Panicum virgatum]|uniref:Translation elongation factor KOW-like domain-containing protein n=1 Tax=Panicum virgatum TaxID=38727 RepID=A0A8T0MMW7_PANVG|nr:hypothetical protein PVAP13_9NG407700 [Panicum virgatum]
MAALRHLAVGPGPTYHRHHGFAAAAATSSLQLRRLPSRPLRSRFSRVYALSSNDIRVGTNIEVDGAPWKVLEFLHVKPGKGAAFVRTKLRNYVTGNTVEKTFRAGSTVATGTIPFKGEQAIYIQGWLPVRVHGSGIQFWTKLLVKKIQNTCPCKPSCLMLLAFQCSS